MFLSRIILDMGNRETMRAMAAPKLFHGAIERCCAYDESRKLWRIDRKGDTYCLLVLTEKQPDFTGVHAQFGKKEDDIPWETKVYDPFLSRLQEGQVWRFRLKANPVHSSKEGLEETSRGKIYAHVTPDQQKMWLAQCSSRYGFLLNEQGFDVVQSQWVNFTKHGVKNRNVSLHTATYEGRLVIKDLECFKNTLICGLGRAKAYGCGLLTLA